MVERLSTNTTQEHPESSQVDEMYNIIQQRCLQQNRKISTMDLTLMEMLNTFDVVVAERKPRSDIANQVYRMILKYEREKTYQSIQDISCEIQSLKKFDQDSFQFGGTGNVSQPFDFQGSFGTEGRRDRSIKSFAEKESSLHRFQPQPQKPSKLPKISLENVLDLQKNESFQNRCHKLTKIESQSHSRANSIPKAPTPQFLAPTPTFLNKDLDMINSKAQSPVKHMFQRQTHAKLPKLNFSDLTQSPIPSIRSSFTHLPTGENVIDSNRVLSFAYYTRRLLLIGWKAFFNHRLNQANKRFFTRIASQKQVKNMKKKVFKGLLQNAKVHQGHGANRRRASVVCNMKLGKKYLELWMRECRESMEENWKLMKVQRTVDQKKRSRILRGWKGVTLSKQVMSVQERTAQHIYKQRYMRLALMGLRLITKFRVHQRNMIRNAKSHNRYRLLTKSLTSFHMCLVLKAKFAEMKDIASKVYDFNLLKLATREMKTFRLNKIQYRKLQQCADNYYYLSQLKYSMDSLKQFCAMSISRKQQHYFSQVYYEKKLKTSFMDFLHGSNMEFLHHSSNVTHLMNRQYLRRIFLALKNMGQERRITRFPQRESFYYSAYLWLPKVKGLEYPKNMALSNQEHYVQARQVSVQKLKSYVMRKVFMSWAKELQQIKEFKSQKQGKLLKKIVHQWKMKSRYNAKYRYILNKYLKQKKEIKAEVSISTQRLQSTFQALRLNKNRRKYERKIVVKYNELRSINTLKKVYLQWTILYKRKMVKESQEQIAEEIYNRRLIEQPYFKWRQQFLQLTKKSNLNNKSSSFFRIHQLKKYFDKMLQTFYSSQNLELLLSNYKKQQRKKLLKKSLCAFLQNILQSNHQVYNFEQAMSLRKQLLLTKAVRVWQKVMPEISQKNRLYRCIKHEKQVKMQVQVLNALKMYYTFRLNKKTTDHFMTTAVQQLTMKRFFGMWNGMLNRKTGLKMLEFILDRTQQRNFFKRVQRKALFEESMMQHMKIFHLYKLQDFTLQAFKKNVQQKYDWQEYTLQIHKISLKLSKKECLRRWREAYQRIQWEEKMGQFVLIQIKNQIMKKYWQVLKERREFRIKKRRVIKERQRMMKDLVINEMRNMTTKRIACRDNEQYLRKQKRKQKLRFIMNAWANELNDLQIIRHLTFQRQQSIATKVLKSWSLSIYQQKRHARISHEIKELSKTYNKMTSLRAWKQVVCNNSETRQKINTVKQIHNKNLLQQVLQGFQQYIDQNREQFQLSNQVKKQVSCRLIKSYWKKWILQSEPRLVKFRVLKCLGHITQNIEHRIFLHKWAQYTYQCQLIENIGEEQYQLKIFKQKKEALGKFKQVKDLKIISRERMHTINDYWIKKAQLRFITFLNFATKKLQQAREDKQKARQYYRWQLSRKALTSIVYQVQKNQQFRVLTEQYYVNLKHLQAPRVFERLRSNVLVSKEHKIKEQFAYELIKEKYYLKYFKALYWNMVYKKEQRTNQKKAFVFRCENLLKNAMQSWKIFSYQRKIIFNKRQIIFNSIMAIDQNITTSLALQSLKHNVVYEQERVNICRGQIVFNFINRVFSILKYHAQYHKTVKRNHKQVALKHKHTKMRGVMMIWMRALDNQSKTKVIQRTKQQRVKQQVFIVLQKLHHARLFVTMNLTKKAIDYQTIAFRSLANYTLQQKKLRLVSAQIMQNEEQRTLIKTFMGIRYQCLIQKNQRILQEKQTKMLVIKSFSGWKYQSILDKTLREYQELRYKKDINAYFTFWYQTYKYQATKKSGLQVLIEKKDYSDKQQAFAQWKKQAFRGTYLDLMQIYMVQPHQEYIAKRCITNWRKYAKFRANKEDIKEHFALMRNSFLVRRTLREWYQATTTNMPARILSTRLQKATDRLFKIKALYKISEYGIRKDYIEENLGILEQNRQVNVQHQFFNMWRQQYAIHALSKIVLQKQERRLMRLCLCALIDNAQVKITQKEQTVRVVEHFGQSMQTTQMTMIRTFNSMGFKLNTDSLKRFYFQQLQMGTQLVQKQRVMQQKAVQYNTYKTQLKYFYRMVAAYYENHEEREQDQRGEEIWQYKNAKKVMNALIMNVLQQRKYRNAQLFYECKVQQKGLYMMRGYLRINQTKSNLNTKMMYFLKKKCISLFKVAFTQWRIKFEQKQFEGQAVVEFENFRNMKLMRIAFDYFKAICQQEAQIKDMTKKAQMYFNKKNYLRMAHTAFYALRDHAYEQQPSLFNCCRRQSKLIIEDKELKALKFYAFNLLSTHLRAWKRESKLNRNRQKRSKMYAIFSAWKFYTKERSLLKKYLMQCNVMMDPNMMSTCELKENAARFSNLKSSNYCESLSSGTPFMSCERMALTPNTGCLNSASPTKYRTAYQNSAKSINNRKR